MLRDINATVSTGCSVSKLIWVSSPITGKLNTMLFIRRPVSDGSGRMNTSRTNVTMRSR